MIDYFAQYRSPSNLQFTPSSLPIPQGFGSWGEYDTVMGNISTPEAFQFQANLPSISSSVAKTPSTNSSLWDSFTNAFKPGVDPKTGLPTRSTFQGYLGNAQTALDLGKSIFDIMGAMKYGKYVDAQRKALEQQMKATRAQMGGYYENQAARRAANLGMGQQAALAEGKEVSAKEMEKWGL
jgi:hypothetical protein